MSEPPIEIDGGVDGDVFTGGKRVIDTGGAPYIESQTISQAAAPPIGVAALHQLPAPLADFTGRKAELAELRSAIQTQGVTISGLRGMGGVGKTALAVVLANELVPDYPDAQIVIELLGTTKPLTAAAAMAVVVRAFEPVAKLPEDEAAMLAAYRSVLHGKKVLLLLDNAAGREQVEPLVPPKGCLLLVTSRARFALPGLKSVNLDSLPPADAAALLIKIAPRIGDSANELALLCGRLPLALRLAGSALAERDELAPAEYARRLRDETRRTAELDEVAASLALSYDLLGHEQRGNWRRLAVFAGAFHLIAAGAVWALDDAAASDVLGTLLRYSLVEYEAEANRWRLHDLARDFARSKLEPSEAQEARGRHSSHYEYVLRAARNAYEAGGQGILRGLAVFDLERANILAGQAWATAHAQVEDLAAQLAMHYPNSGVDVLDLRQHPREQIAWRETALKAARQLAHREAEGIHLGSLGIAYADLGEPRRAIEYFEQRLVIAREIGDRRGEGAGLFGLGTAYVDLSEPQRAIDCYEQALVILRETGDRRAEGAGLGSLGNAYTDLNEPQRAIDCYEQSLVIARETGDRRGEGQGLGNLGNAYSALGKPRRATEYYELALVIDREIGDRRGEALWSWNLGDEYAKLGQLEKAMALMQVAVDFEREIGHSDAEADAAKVEALRTRLARR